MLKRFQVSESGVLFLQRPNERSPVCFKVSSRTKTSEERWCSALANMGTAFFIKAATA